MQFVSLNNSECEAESAYILQNGSKQKSAQEYPPHQAFFVQELTTFERDSRNPMANANPDWRGGGCQLQPTPLKNFPPNKI